MRLKWLLSLLTVVISISSNAIAELPDGFSYCDKIIPSLQLDMRYASNNNFTGKPLPGYKKATCILTTPALTALAIVNLRLETMGLGIKIYDGYRPQKAVDQFIAWKDEPDNKELKDQYYPDLSKAELFRRDYIASKSGHSRGSTIDLTIVDRKTGKELDFGGAFDFFGPVSGPFYTEITSQQRANRLLLRSLMTGHQFRPHDEEWWHFTLMDEPFPATYFNFDIE